MIKIANHIIDCGSRVRRRVNVLILDEFHLNDCHVFWVI